MKNPMNNCNEKAKDGTIVRTDLNPSLENENYSRRPSNGFEAGREMSLKEFLSTKLPRKHITPEIISSIREKIIQSDLQ